jgi:mRNA interferase MazF
MRYQRGDIVSAPFRFSESDTFKRRPVVVVSNDAVYGETGGVVVAMITSANRSSWPLDLALQNWSAAGLAKPCLIRMKLATIACETIKEFVGKVDAETLDMLGARLVKVLT